MVPDPSRHQDRDDGDADTTQSTSTRYPYTNDVLAGILVVCLIALTASYPVRGMDVPLWVASVFGLAVGTAVVWTFGKGAFSAAADALGGQGGK